MESGPSHAGDPARRNAEEDGVKRMLVVAAAMAAELMPTLESTIVHVALPHVDGTVGAATDEPA
jgi:hypothetical protein